MSGIMYLIRRWPHMILLKFHNGIESVLANNWLMSFYISLLSIFVVFIYFIIRLGIFFTFEKSSDSNVMSVFKKSSPSFTISGINVSPGNRLLSTKAVFFASSRYFDPDNNILKEKFLSLYGNTVTIDYVNNSSYSILYEKPIGFYILISPFLMPLFFWGYILVSGEPGHQSSSFSFLYSSVFGTNFSMSDFLRSCFFSPVVSSIFIVLINLLEGNL
jgi:hypothetical protein